MEDRETIEMDYEGMMMVKIYLEKMKMMNWNGTIDVGLTIAETFKTKITTEALLI